jgi:hypothetical protein
MARGNIYRRLPYEKATLHIGCSASMTFYVFIQRNSDTAVRAQPTFYYVTPPKPNQKTESGIYIIGLNRR